MTKLHAYVYIYIHNAYLSVSANKSLLTVFNVPLRVSSVTCSYIEFSCQSTHGQTLKMSEQGRAHGFENFALRHLVPLQSTACISLLSPSFKSGPNISIMCAPKFICIEILCKGALESRSMKDDSSHPLLFCIYIEQYALSGLGDLENLVTNSFCYCSLFVNRRPTATSSTHNQYFTCRVCSFGQFTIS